MGDNKSMTHQISSVAHHFFSPDDLWSAEAAGARVRSPSDLQFLTAAPGRGHLAAWTAARLARASLSAAAGTESAARPVVAVGDCHRQPWSVRRFLDGQDSDHLHDLLRPAATLVNRGAGARIRRLSPRETAGGEAVGPESHVTWLNLGQSTEESLGRLWRLLGGLESFLQRNLPPADGLVWCLLGEEADSTVGAWLLGSLAARFGCRQVKVLLFPADYDLGRTDTTADEGVRGRREACRHTLAAALTGASLEILDVPRRTDDGADGLWSCLAESLKMGATSRRGQPASDPAEQEVTV